MLITFIRAGACQVRPIFTFIPADVPQIPSVPESPFAHMGYPAPKPKKKALKLKGKCQEPGASTAPATSTTAPGNDESPEILKVVKSVHKSGVRALTKR